MKQGWEIKKLGDVCDKASSNVSQNQLDNEVGDYPIFGASGLIKNVSFYHQAKPYLSIVKDGSGVGRVTKMDAYTSVIGTLQYILPNEGIDLDYLNYSLMSIDFKKYVAGAAIPHIYFKDYKNEPFLWMPLSEQQQIVSVLNEAFAAIAKAKANAEQNLKNAKELFESYLQGVFENKGEGWEEKTLGEVTIIQRGSSPRPKGAPKYFSVTKTEFNWITISDISSFCEDNILLQTREWLTEEGSKQSRFVDKNEFIIAVSGSTTGKCCITGIKGFIYDGLAVVKIIDNKIEPKFLLSYMMSLYSFINNSKAGAAFPNINTEYLKNLPFSFPSLKDQQSIVRKLDALSTETKKLEAIYQQKINDLEELKKSVLQKAFSGELKTATALV
jgi:type I restriction enzyme S subunit